MGFFVFDFLIIFPENIISIISVLCKQWRIPKTGLDFLHKQGMTLVFCILSNEMIATYKLQTPHLFIGHEFDSWLWSNFYHIDTVSSPKGLNSALFQHVLETVSYGQFVLLLYLSTMDLKCSYKFFLLLAFFIISLTTCAFNTINHVTLCHILLSSRSHM